MTPLAFTKILNSEFQLYETNQENRDFEKALSVYRERLNQFNDNSILLNAWIFLQRQEEKLLPGTIKLNLSSVNLDTYFSIHLDAITMNYDINSLYRTFPEAKQITSGELAKAINDFTGIDQTSKFRGKFLIEFLRKFLVILMNDFHSNSPVFFSTKGKTKLNLSRANIISDLSQYADTPPELIIFLRKLMHRGPNTTKFPIFIHDVSKLLQRFFTHKVGFY